MDPVSIILGLANFAPSLMKWAGIGDKAVSVATTVADMAQSITGTKNTPEALEALKHSADLAAQFNLAVLAANSELDKAYLADKSDARARDEKFIVAGTRNYRADFITGITVLGIIVIAAISVLVADISEFAKNVLLTTLGVLISEYKQITSFEFGSTRTSKDKDATINSLTQKET